MKLLHTIRSAAKRVARALFSIPNRTKHDPVNANRRMLKSCRGVLTAKEAGLWR